jgi:hypothetical protein
MKPAKSRSANNLILALVFVGSTSNCLSGLANTAKLPDPILKPGLWEIVTTESKRKDFKSTQILCAGPKAHEVQLARKQLDAKRLTCTSSDLRDVRSGKDHISYTWLCTKNYGVAIKSQVTFKGDFSREFTHTETASFQGSTPMGEMTQTRQFKYKDSCPKDMKPGDTFIKNNNEKPMPTWNRYTPPQTSEASSDASKSGAKFLP